MIKIENLSIDLPGFSLADIQLSVGRGEFFILLGPTGAGKTLILEAIAGLVPVTRGCIFVQDREVTHLMPEKRGVGIVYQDYALFPHLTVMENIRYGLPYHRADRAGCEARIGQLVLDLGISSLVRRSVRHLSGGEKQRVALARALAVNPAVLLLDEPLSALDTGLRDEIQKLLKNLHQTMNTTFIMVTHDFTEALFLGQRAAIIHKGRVEQTGTVSDVFKRPQTPFAAVFTGFKNVFPAEIDNGRASVGGLRLQLSANHLRGRRHLAIRAEDIHIQPRAAGAAGAVNTFRASVETMLDRGPYGEIGVTIEKQAFTVFVKKAELQSICQPDTDNVWVTIAPQTIHVI